MQFEPNQHGTLKDGSFASIYNLPTVAMFVFASAMLTRCDRRFDDSPPCLIICGSLSFFTSVALRGTRLCFSENVLLQYAKLHFQVFIPLPRWCYEMLHDRLF